MNKLAKGSHPNSFCCPITGDLIKEPVMDTEGNTYEKSAIISWLQKNQTSPVTGKSLDMNSLIPNLALKKSIEEYKKNLKEPEAKVELKLNAVTSMGNSLVSLDYKKIEGLERTPADVCCVIDVSGSMGSEAIIKTSNGYEGFGFSTLDLVKHAVRTVIAALGETDRLSIVTFTDQAQLVFDLTLMDEEGKRKAELALDSLHPLSSTNLWDGLYQALELFKRANSNNASIFLLTDGMPNVTPPRGHIPMIKKYIQQNGLTATVNTFGFGYELDSKLLNEFSIEGNGAYSFIPDGAFVGTVFVNTLSNLLTSIASKITLKFDLKEIDINDTALLSQHKFAIENNTLNLQIGALSLGQPKNFVLPFIYKGDRRIQGQVQFDTPYWRNNKDFFDIKVKEIDDPEIEVNRLRIAFVNEVTKAMGLVYSNPHEAVTNIRNFITTVQTSKVKDHPYIKDLLKDLEDQVAMAFSVSDYFLKWGKHYLPSLARAHLLQQCNNFKDPGLQHFGGEPFIKLRDSIDEIFLKIIPPSPSARTSRSSVFTGNMSMFHDPDNICFDGDCKVRMADGSLKLVKEVKKGDNVWGLDGQQSKVKCVIKTECLDRKAKLVELKGGLRLTPWHPVKLNGNFVFPCQVGEVKNYQCPAVYNFVLESGHMLQVNDIECITLAHGFEDNIPSHPYFGSQAIVNDLKKFGGWNEGLVELNHKSIVRDEKTGLISGIKTDNKKNVGFNHSLYNNSLFNRLSLFKNFSLGSLFNKLPFAKGRKVLIKF